MGERRPTIGITTYGPSAANDGELPAFSLPRHYVDAVVSAGGVPVMLGASALPADDVLAVLDGLVVAGGGDIAPDAYGGRAHETIYSVNPARDSFELSLVRRALERADVPTLGICRGMQIMNIALGGDLVPHLPDVYGDSVAHRLPPRVPTTHSVRVEAVGAFGSVFREAELPVCSWHHQAVRTLGKGLRAAAHAPDGVIEAVALESHPFALGVQWHPEMQAAEARKAPSSECCAGRARW